MVQQDYNPADFSKNEEELLRKFRLQRDDAKDYFTQIIKPRLDRSYKLYVSYNGDRAKEIKSWQANIFVPYVHAVVETLMPRILDARPDFTIQGRSEDDQMKVPKLQQLLDYDWEISKADDAAENVTRASLINGIGFLQVYWKKDERDLSFLETTDLAESKYTWIQKKVIFYDAPYVEFVDNYALWYDWRNIEGKSKQFWLKRLILTGEEIKRRYPMAEKKRLNMALAKNNGDLTDYASVRNDVKLNHEDIVKGADYGHTSSGILSNRNQNQGDVELAMHEVFEWWRPFEDKYCVMVNEVPIFKGAEMPIPYDFKEAPFIEFPYLRLPGEFEGYGIPMILENPQLMLNMIKNQRLDSTTLSIHKMWVVNPLANIDKNELVTRPFGIIYSTDPGGVKEIQFSDIKQSAYREEDQLKADMRYASGVDDFSMGAGGSAGSATEVRHLRESTLERVRLFVNHLGSGFSTLMRYWISMHRQFYTNPMTIRILGESGQEEFPVIEQDDLMGEFDFKATVNPSIAGMNDIKKKQDMDLFQLLSTMPFVDVKKLTSKLLYDWNWNVEAISKSEEELQQEQMAQQQQQIGPDGQPLPVGPEGPGGPGGQPAPGGMPPELQAAMMGGGMPGAEGGDMKSQIMQKLGLGGASPFKEAQMPINLLQAQNPPPTAKGVPAKGNSRGLNRGGKVNTNIKTNNRSNPESSLMNRALNIQR
jgi:hypothetical protein